MPLEVEESAQGCNDPGAKVEGPSEDFLPDNSKSPSLDVHIPTHGGRISLWSYCSRITLA